MIKISTSILLLHILQMIILNSTGGMNDLLTAIISMAIFLFITLPFFLFSIMTYKEKKIIIEIDPQNLKGYTIKDEKNIENL